MNRRLSAAPRANRPLQIETLESRCLLAGDLLAGELFRTFDGTGNNLMYPQWGAAGAELLRLSTVEYADGISEPAAGADGSGRPNPREVSNRVLAQDTSLPNDRQLTSFVFQWGQFLDHDMGLTEEARPFEPFSISVPADDPDLDPRFPIPVLRSRYNPASGTGSDNPRQQINQITAYLDGSNIYGSDATKARGLRANYGGLLLTSDGTRNVAGEGNLLPWNYQFEGEFLENATPPPFAPQELFIAGDIRANEQPGLTALHTLFVREHNYQARRLAAEWRPGTEVEQLTGAVDEAIYQMARRIVSAEIQSITYNEFLPALLGPDQLASYGAYDPHVNAGMANIFSHALYRVGHTMLPNELLRLNNQGHALPEGPIALGEAFFDPTLITQFGIEPFLKGLAVQGMQEVDARLVDGVRNMLFDPPAQFDLGATNLQRGRDHGLPDYNQAMIDFGLEPLEHFNQISSDPAVAAAMEQVYAGDLDNIDVWLGAVAADHVPGGNVGELIHTVLVDQFTRLRDGDRFYFENVFRGRRLAEIQNTRLAHIVLRNTELTNLQEELFRDESVFVYRPEQGGGPALVTLEADEGMLRINDRRGRVLAQRPLDETRRVVVFGTDRNDRLVLDSSLAELPAIEIELHGGGGGRDRLLVEGTGGDDRIEIGRTHLELNALNVFFGNFERIGVSAGAGTDVMRAADDATRGVRMAGGPDDDLSQAGTAGQLLLGGRGNDPLIGGSGRDVLVGGPGRDRLVRGTGDEVLIAGTPRFFETSKAWRYAGMLWQGRLSHEARVCLTGGPTDGLIRPMDFPLPTLFDDAAVDALWGEEGHGVFLDPLDQIVDRRPHERVR